MSSTDQDTPVPSPHQTQTPTQKSVPSSVVKDQDKSIVELIHLLMKQLKEKEVWTKDEWLGVIELMEVIKGMRDVKSYVQANKNDHYNHALPG